MAQGLAIIGMIALHLFCRIDNLPYNVHIFLRERSIIYYIGLFGDFAFLIIAFAVDMHSKVCMKMNIKLGKE